MGVDYTKTHTQAGVGWIDTTTGQNHIMCNLTRNLMKNAMEQTVLKYLLYQRQRFPQDRRV